MWAIACYVFQCDWSVARVSLFEKTNSDPMRVEHLALPGLVLLHPACSGDEDATFTYFHERQELLAASVDIPNVQAHASRYKPKFTVRGLHFQKPPRAQTKVVRVAHGRILNVAWPCGQSPGLLLEIDRGWQRLQQLDSPFSWDG